MHAIRQTIAILQVSLSELPQRIGPALTIVVGVTCAVGVLVSMLAMGAGARRQETGDVRPDRAVLIASGARYGQSNIARDEAAAIIGLPGIARSAAGEPIVAFISMEPMEGRRRITGSRIYFPLIGITKILPDYRPELHMTRGRMFEAGLHELIAGNACARQFTGFELGDRRHIHGSDWTIVGTFDAGQSQQCVVYADVDSLMSTFKRNSYASVEVRLKTAADFGVFRDAVAANAGLHLEARREREVIEDDFRQLNAILDFVSYVVGTIMAIAATLGAVNSLYAIVDGRRRELATLRAIGFGSGPIIVAILAESMLLALPGALLGGVLAWAFFNGLSASPFGYSFQLAVTLPLAALGVAWALAMGVFGGLLPALRAARVPVTTALRAAG
jgi:putative ABC transport system permease protein